MLTRKQYELLIFIDKRLKKTGISPSFDEMKDALSLRSKSGIHRLILGLEERGFIRRLPHRARALEVLRVPENMAPGSFAPNVIEGDFRMSGAAAPPVGEAVQLPLYGRIAAGTPIEAVGDHSNVVEVPASLVGKGEHFALEVEGDSMHDAGIQDGDTVVLKRSDTADNGAIVVALVDDNEVTLKRLRRKGNSIALEPANKDFETRIFGPGRVKVQGSLVGLIRKY
ncbi:MAG: transcriptional repressor LexA [Proteobacteria bacterium]|nr:transcriptional repressor LexA [Pseudomonadota bacterium]